MSVNVNKVQFANPAYTIDKIAAYSNGADSFPGGFPTNVQYTIAAAPDIFDPVDNFHTIPNPYGKKLLSTLSFSVDGVNYYDGGMELEYFNTTNQEPAVQLMAICGCSDSSIIIWLHSEYTAAQTVHVRFALDSIT